MEELLMDQVQKKRALLAFAGGVLAFAGYYLPWYSVVFAPPGGYAIVIGQQVSAFTYAFSGLNQSNTTSSALLHPTIIAMLLVGLFDLFKLTLSPASANKAIHITAKIFQSHITGSIVDSIQALAHVIVSFSWIAFLFLYLGLGTIAFPIIFANNLGGGADAIRASHYFTLHFGIGLIFILTGLIISGIAIFQKIAIVVGLLLVVLIVLVLFHSAYLGQFFHFLGF
jgi:hypothetical protein